MSMEESMGKKTLSDVRDVVDSVNAGALEKAVDLEEKGSTCKDEWVVDVRKSEIASDLVDVVGRLTVEMESIGVRKCVVVDGWMGVEALADSKWSMMVASKSLDMEDVSSAVVESVVAMELVAETVVAEIEDGENRMDGLSMQ